MLRYKLALVAALVGTGCASNPVVVPTVQRVEVPVPVVCTVSYPDRPSYNFDRLTVSDSVFDKVKALLADRLLSISYQAELEAALSACAKK
jgi:pyridoxal/pyridoxine/pyridoxamine kinase